MFRHSLVPLDGSRLAEAVLPVVSALATTLGTRLTLLHVIEHDAPRAVHGDRHLGNQVEAEHYLAAIASRLSAEGINVDYHCHTAAETDVARSIVQHAEQIRVDLVALCTHGRGGLRTVLVGSIAQQVLQLGTVPVLVVRPTPDEVRGRFEPQGILVPLDPDAEGERALPTAAELAARFHAVVRLLCVVPTVATVRGDEAAVARLLPTATGAVLEMETDEAWRYVSGVAARLTDQGVRATAEVRRGDVIDELALAAQPRDLLVMATHGQAGIGALWSGSVAARVLGRVSCPVWLIRHA